MKNISEITNRVMPFIYLLAAVLLFFSNIDMLSDIQRRVLSFILLVYAVIRFRRAFRPPPGGAVILLLLLVPFASCRRTANTENTDTPTSGTIQMAADETFLPVVQAQIDVFQAIYSTAHITPLAVPEGKAFELLAADSVRLVLATRTLTDKEVAYYNSKKIFPKQVQIATDGIAVLLHPSNPDSVLLVQQLAAILRGEAGNWKQINKDNPGGDIRMVFDNPASGIVRYMIDSVAHTDSLSALLSAVTDCKGVIDYVAEHENAIGLIGVSWVSDRDDSTHLTFLSKVRVARIGHQRTDAYKPYQAYLATQQYPLTRSVWLISTDPHIGLADGFIAFASSDKGQRIILKTGILPATAPIRLLQVNNDH